MTESDEQKRRVVANFNALAPQYDAIRFVKVAAQSLIERADLQPGMRVLDVATGTGLVAMVAARLVGSGGMVVGIDISPEMLARARAKAEAAGATNVEFREGDAEQLDLADRTFDLVLCASSLFFVPDMAAVVREIWRVLTPGGRVGFTGFGANFLAPVQALWTARLAPYGVTYRVPPAYRLADPTACAELLHNAGFTDVDVQTEQRGYYLSSAERWDELVSSLEYVPLMKLTPEQREQIKAEHLAELTALASPQGIWIDVPVNLAFGRKPLS
jgi:ubiquinone/menaquinone biosynthesis C-methylase UbiE